MWERVCSGTSKALNEGSEHERKSDLLQPMTPCKQQPRELTRWLAPGPTQGEEEMNRHDYSRDKVVSWQRPRDGLEKGNEWNSDL